VLDPFIGSGQTAIAALKVSRHYVGYDISKEYVNLAQKRIKGYLQGQITLFPERIDTKPLVIAERPRGKEYQVKSKHGNKQSPTSSKCEG
jgi:DNA modification methylase